MTAMSAISWLTMLHQCASRTTWRGPPEAAQAQTLSRPLCLPLKLPPPAAPLNISRAGEGTSLSPRRLYCVTRPLQASPALSPLPTGVAWCRHWEGSTAYRISQTGLCFPTVPLSCCAGHHWVTLGDSSSLILTPQCQRQRSWPRAGRIHGHRSSYRL